jgi:chromosome segregation protein
MLRLEKMEISGFKSFSDRTEVRFPEGITAVVGPNGCGKSNIGDAINWALGEQSPKMLRGKQMADVIFAGSAARKPVGLAEVSLHLRGAEGMGQSENGTLVVTRRLFRSGDSEYLLNGKRARLKQIQELLEQGHVGARTYATIEQGRIDQILNAKPKERRLLIEDAAGIAGYKHKRRLTELKLEATEANLLRVNDIVVEVERQIRSLKRQAGRARRYRRLRDELRAKERVHFGVRSTQLDAELERTREAERRAHDAQAEAAAKLSKLEVRLLEERSGLEAANKVLREAAERLHRTEIEIDRQEGQIRGCRERIAEAEATETRQTAEAEKLAQRLDELAGVAAEQEEIARGVCDEVERIRSELSEQQALVDDAQRAQRELREELESLRRRQFEAMNHAAETRNRRQSAAEALDRIAAQRQRLEADCSQTSDDLSRLASETRTLEEQLADQRSGIEVSRSAHAQTESLLRQGRRRQEVEAERLSAARQAEKSAGARLATLEDVATRFAGVSDGVRTLLGENKTVDVRTGGVIADFIEAAAEVESAAEGYLESFLPTVIFEEDADVCRAAELLRAEGAGRTSLICRSQPAGAMAVGTTANGKGEIPGTLLEDSRVIGRLRDRLTLRSSANGFIQDRFGDAVVVDRLETALDLHRRHPASDFLTTDGDVVFASGVVHAGGRPGGDHGLLAHQRQIRETRDEFEAAASRAAEQQKIVDALREEISRLDREVRSRREDLDEGERRLVGLELQTRRAAEDHERTGRRSDVLGDELQQLRAETGRLLGVREELSGEVERAEVECRELEEKLEARTGVWEGQEAHLHAESEKATTLRETLAARLQRQEAVDRESDRLAEAAAELRSRLAEARGDSERARERAEAAKRLQRETEAALADRLEERRASNGQVAGMEHEIAERQERVGGQEETTRQARDAVEALRDGTREAEVARARAESSREHLDELCRQELTITATQAVQEAIAAGAVLEEVIVEELDTQIVEIKNQIDKIGPVNMTAIDEFAELEERHLFLSTQRDDLEKSMESLKETIRRVNRSSRERFAEAFEAIRTSYQEVFKLLFNGGRADLRLEEGEDVLECGIEILAQPPGKRLANINLLSGGEKALSAIALLFAVFRFQPSPFCLLDEVDAALDDSNVGRFSRMLGEYAEQTQFIIVTHNKLTMESADLLYGVTMDEPGVSRLISLRLD